MFGSKEKAMSKETHAPRNPTEIHTNVLYKARQACYKARDAFYACLEKESDQKSTEIASVGPLYPLKCKTSRAELTISIDNSVGTRLQRLFEDRDTRKGPLVLPQPYTFKPSNS